MTLRSHAIRLLLFLTCLLPQAVPATELIMPPTDVDLIGEIRYVKARHEDTLLDIARYFDLGKNEITNANPGVDTWLPGEGKRILLPTRFVLPDVPREGLVLNLPEMRLYYFPPARRGQFRYMYTHPISIGRMDWKTPLGKSRIVAKVKDPEWRPPKSIQQEAVEKGEALPDVVPAGPDNPLGRYAMRLGVPGYLIHSTNKPYGLGMRVSHGCIRMYPEDIERLFDRVQVNTPVHIIDEPVKLGWLADTLFVEVHPPLEEDEERQRDLMRSTLELIHRERELRPFVLDGPALKWAVQEQLGIPVPVSKSGLFGTDSE
jgi:L,D-transpeptidase ErfK/SrfK